MRVLIVDDHEAYLTGAVMILRSAGHEAFGCASFQEARRRILDERFDVLILDVRLGAYNGLQLALCAPDGTRKIAMSAHVDAGVLRDAVQVGAEFVAKPWDPVEFGALLAPAAVAAQRRV